MKNIEEFITILSKYRDGDIKLDDVDETYESVGDFTNFADYLNDGALRADDPSYSVMQEKALLQFIKLLKSQDYDGAKNVKFR